MEGVAAADFDDADVVASFEEGLEATMNETTVTVTGATDARRRYRSREEAEEAVLKAAATVAGTIRVCTP